MQVPVEDGRQGMGWGAEGVAGEGVVVCVQSAGQGIDCTLKEPLKR